MKTLLSVALLAASAAAASANPLVRIKIGRVPTRYSPTNATVSERVSMQGFHFEVNPETVRARIVVEYTYPDQIVYQKDDDKRGPQPTVVQLPQLQYVAADHAIVYVQGPSRTVCAYVRKEKGILHHGLLVQNTGACTVKVQRNRVAEDDGWKIRRFNVLEAYFEVR
jgi:hypothetical protein